MRQTFLRTLAPLSLALALGACATDIPGAVENPKTPTERFATPVTTKDEHIWLAVHAQGLSPNQSAALAGLVESWREDEGGTITLKVPTAGADSAASFRMIEAARAQLVASGVPEEKIAIGGYRFVEGGQPLLMVGYERYVVEIPKCGENWTNMARSMGNGVQPNFGCATTANFAAMIANPADLHHPRAMTPQDAARRQDVLDKYRKGMKTSSEVDERASGAVSKAVQ